MVNYCKANKFQPGRLAPGAGALPRRPGELKGGACKSASTPASDAGTIFDNRDEILTFAELAVRLKKSESGLRKLIKRDPNFPQLRRGHEHFRFSWGEVRSYLSQRERGRNGTP